MKKEFSAEDYVRHMDGLLRLTRVVASNLAFNAAGLNAGEEDLHREKLLKSAFFLKAWVDGLLEELADEEEIERTRHALMENLIEGILKRTSEKGGE